MIALDRMSDLWGWVTNWNWGTVPDWLMALVTGCAVYVAYRTLNYIKQQADSNEAAAHAAKQSAAEALRAADSLIASERAHVFGKVELVSPFVPYMDKGEMQAFARTLFINHGKTTAIIVNMSGDAFLARRKSRKNSTQVPTTLVVCRRGGSSPAKESFSAPSNCVSPVGK